MVASQDSAGLPVIAPALVERVVGAVEASRDDLVAFLRRLLGYRTASQDPAFAAFPGEARACLDDLAGFLRSLGAEITTWEARPASFPSHPVVAARIPGRGGGRSLAVNGHIDVVPAGDEATWSRDPWGGDLVDGRLYGRGAIDMKGGVAVALWAARVLHDLGLPLRGDLWFHLVSDEEVVGWGSRECAARLPRPDGVLDPEPTDLAVMPTEGGLEHFRIEVEGREAHAGVRWRSVHAGGHQGGGVNAIEKLIKIIVALQELEREWANTRTHPMLPAGFNTLLPGIIMGGPGGGRDGRLNAITNPGTTPNYASVEYNLWYLPHERLDDIKQEIEAYVHGVCQLDGWLREHPPRITWRLRNISFPPSSTDADHPLVQTAVAAVRATGRPVRVEGPTYVSDLAWYGERGIPGALLGPGHITRAHAPDEYVTVEELVGATTLYALVAAAWCGVAS